MPKPNPDLKTNAIRLLDQAGIGYELRPYEADESNKEPKDVTDGEYLDGEKHGMWITYYANGSKRSEGAYDRGKKEGLWLQYWPNGNKKSEGTFRNDLFTGVYTAWHENGKRRVQGRYNDYKGVPSDGKKEGEWCDYEEDGETIWRKITYHYGSRAKPDEIFRPDTQQS